VSAATYSTLLDAAAAVLLVTAVLLVWRRDLAAMIRLLAAQGFALGAVPLLAGSRSGDAQLVVVAVAVMALRAVLFPRLLSARLRGEPSEDRETAPLVNTTAALLIAAVLVIVAYLAARPLVAVDPSTSTRAVPAGIAMVLIAVLLLVTRRKALSQVVALLVLDNGIDAVAFLATPGVPLMVELGASLDVLFALVILGVLTGRMYNKFGGSDLDELRALRDR
jgi:hydrogenase-4 component E